MTENKRALANDTSQQRVDTSEEQRQEPVAWFSKLPGNLLSIKISGKPTEGDWQPLYTRPQQCSNCASLMEQNTELDKKLSEWVSLTEEDFWELAPVWFERETSLIDFVAMVEGKLKEKNR